MWNKMTELKSDLPQGLSQQLAKYTIANPTPHPFDSSWGVIIEKCV